MKNDKAILNDGVYLVIDPSMNPVVLWTKLREIQDFEFAAIQIWDHFAQQENKLDFIDKLLRHFDNRNYPVLINNQWELCNKCALDGVHFDALPDNFSQIKKALDQREMIFGVTCNNDINVAVQAEELGMNYLSFCSMFPSSTAVSCDLVTFETVEKSKSVFKGKIFLSGGIHRENIDKLQSLNCNGVAVISGIMQSKKPLESATFYQRHFLQKEHELTRFKR